MATHGQLHFRYEALTSPDGTRLLHLNPGSIDDHLSGWLECVRLNSVPSYEALSYEWGNPTKNHNITLQNGQIIYITESLHCVLRDIRLDVNRGERVVWADAICINQQDIQELQQQVSMMGSIYCEATQVITYIGPERDNSALGIAFAKQLDDYYTLLGDEKPDPRLHSAEAIVGTGLPSLADRRWAAVKALILRTWASRCWCVQEFLLNKNQVMICGRVEIPTWSLIPNIVQLVFQRALPIFLLPNADEDPHSLRECLTSLSRWRTLAVYNKRRFPLLTLLNYSHPFQATDPRDKIYSVLGQASDRQKIALAVDYSCKTEELYIAVATRIIKSSPTLDMLYSNLHKKSHALPSWVPDWSNWQFGSHGVAYAGDSAASGGTNAQVRVHGTKIDVSGCLIDKVLHLSEPIGPHFGGLDRGIEQRKAWLDEQIDFVQRLTHDRDPRNADILDVLWRTLIGNTTMHEMVAKPEYKASFNALHQYSGDSSPAAKAKARDFLDAVRRRSRYRRLAITERGYLVAMPETTDIGDWVAMFHGADLLLAIRPHGDEFTYLGHAYLHGFMHGEVLRLEWYKKIMITLV